MSREDTSSRRRHNSISGGKPVFRVFGKLLSRSGSKKVEKSSEGTAGLRPKPSTMSIIRVARKDLFKKNDIIIAVMGPAGSGKSTFIQEATGQDLGVGHSLQSFMNEPIAIRVPLIDTTDLVLLDTPGFNDTYPSGLDITKCVSDWLRRACGSGVQLTGILYLQSILDRRGGGMLQKNLRVFRNLCGKDKFRRIVIATTMWPKIDSEVGATREHELRCDYGVEAIKGGSAFMRFENTRQSAWRVLDSIISLEFDHRWIQTQAELVALRKDLPNTEAGQQLTGLVEDVVVAQQHIRNRIKGESLDPEVSGVLELMSELDGLEEKRIQIVTKICQLEPSLLHRVRCLLNGTCESSSRSTHATSSFLLSRCRDMVPRITENNNQNALVRQLSGEEAQQMVDFLSTVLHEVDVLAADEWKRVLSLYSRLAKSAQVYPQCYELKGVQYDPSPIAEGGFANVHKGTHQNGTICLKIVKQGNVKLMRALIKELTLWDHLSHPNILPFYGAYTIAETSQTCLLCPWMENGNLRDYVSNYPQQPRIPWISDIATGLAYLHRLDIVHGDLKGENILVSDDGRALIMDFGLSYIGHATTKTTTTSTGGTTNWMAPELLDHSELLDRPTKACDVWSFGCLCYEVLSRRAPFYHYSRTPQVIAALQRKELPRRPKQEDGVSDEIDDRMWGLMMDCWNHTPQNRPTLEEIYNRIASDPRSQDSRPKRTEGAGGDAPAFRRAVRTESKSDIDLERVYQVLRRIQETV